MRFLTINQSNLFAALLTVALAMSSSTAVFAETIALKREQGTFVVPVVVNGELTLNFMIDSGASDVSIPADVVSTLVRTGTIENGDFIGSQQYRLADGSVQRERRIRIRSVRVGSIEIRNVVASEAPAAGMPLLGQSFLARLPSWSIDNQRQVLVVNQSAGNAIVTNASPVETVKSDTDHPTLVKHHKQASATEPDPAEQLAQQQCDSEATLFGVDNEGPLEKAQFLQVCQARRIKKIREYANVPQDLLAQQHQADCALRWASALQSMEFYRQQALWKEKTFGMKPRSCLGGTRSGECVFDKKELLRLHMYDRDRHREDICTEADMLSRGGAPE